MAWEEAVAAFRSLDCFHQRFLTVRVLRQLLPALDDTFLPQETMCVSPDLEAAAQSSSAPEVVGHTVRDISETQLSFVLELQVMCGDISGMLQLIEHLLHGPVADGDNDDTLEKAPSQHGKVGNRKVVHTLPLRLAPLIVSLLHQYHACVVLSHRQTCSIFAG